MVVAIVSQYIVSLPMYRDTYHIARFLAMHTPILYQAKLCDFEITKSLICIHKSPASNCIFLFCMADIIKYQPNSLSNIKKLFSICLFPCFQHHSHSIIMVFCLPLKSKHWRYHFRQHWHGSAFFSKLATIFLCGSVCYCCFHGFITLFRLCPQTVGSTVVDASTMSLAGILTGLHMDGCLLSWLGVDWSGDKAILPHPTRIAGVSEPCLCVVWTTAFLSHPFRCHTHAWIATHKKQTL